MPASQALCEQLVEAATACADRTALWVDGHAYGYADLFDRASRLAEILSGREEALCVLYCRKNLTRYVSILACVLAGKVFVPVDPAMPVSYGQRIARQVDPALFVLDSGDVERDEEILHGQRVRPPAVRATWDSGDLRWQLVSADTAAARGGHDEVEPGGAYLMFTSGSTGVPKAVLVTHRNLESYLSGATCLFRPTPDDRFAQVNAYTFDLSMHDIFLAWSCGAAVYALPETTPYQLPSLLRRHRISFWLSVPTTGVSLANLGVLTPGSLPSLRCTLFCGEPLPQRLARAWHLAACQSRLFNIYGPTECTIAVTAFEWRPEFSLPDVVPIGWPYPAQRMCVVDERLREVAANQVGELCIGGGQVVPGYHANRDQTAARFVALPGREGTWYRTGDWVQEDARWGLVFKGRRDDQLQVRGYRVERLEVETLMRSALGVDSVAVVGWPVSEGNLVEGLVAFISDTRLTPHNARQKLCQDLPEYMWPRQIYIQQLPYTSSRKVDYAALKRQLSELAPATRDVRPPPELERMPDAID
jgi:amino acid adenylation domain-containing protein